MNRTLYLNSLNRYSLAIALLIGGYSLLYSQSDQGLKKHILNQELKSIEEIGQDTIFLEYGLNKFLEEFIRENILSESQELEFHDFRKHLTVTEQKSIFNVVESDYLLDQLQNANGKIVFLLDLPDKNNFSFLPIEKVRKNYRMGVPLETDIFYFILSEPVVTKNKEFVIIAFSEGYKNSSAGGIHIYKKEKKKYVLRGVFESWVE